MFDIAFTMEAFCLGCKHCVFVCIRLKNNLMITFYCWMIHDTLVLFHEANIVLLYLLERSKPPFGFKIGSSLEISVIPMRVLSV